MIELTVLCEGPSEVEFVQRVLTPHLRSLAIFPKPTPLRNSNFGVIPWSLFYRSMKASIGQSRSHQFTTSMIDLYALPADYSNSVILAVSKEELVRSIEAAMHARMPNPRWIPYVQLHEFEALLFTDIEKLSGLLPGADLANGLRDLIAETAELSPEEIDDGPTTAPSKRILRHIPEYAKAQIGPATLEAIGLPKLRQCCPHFNDWVTRLEALSKDP